MNWIKGIKITITTAIVEVSVLVIGGVTLGLLVLWLTRGDQIFK